MTPAMPYSVEVCAGAGGQALGLEQAGFAHAALVELEGAYCKTCVTPARTGKSCVYHFALEKLEASVKDLGNSEAEDILAIMIQGKRLKDIADLPFDLAV